MSYHKGFTLGLDKDLNTRGMLLSQIAMNEGEILAIEDLFTSSMGEVGFEPGEN